MGRVIVVGGGASGMMAAISAAGNGHHVILIEQNEKLGKKLFITGKGRCNVTNDSDVENLLRHVVHNSRFLYSAFYQFDSRSMMDFLQEQGLTLKTERGNRVFPASDHSSDVIKVLEKTLRESQVEIHLNTKVTGLLTGDGRCSGVLCRGKGVPERVSADAVVIATGGAAYPVTGATGDGYRFARKAGHTVLEPEPSLVPFQIREGFCKQMQGLSLKNVSLKILDGKKKLYEEQGEMLFTHFGISGPLVLTASCMVTGKERGLKAVLDLKPALTDKQLDDRLLRDFAKYQNSYFKNCFNELLPAKMIPVIVGLSAIAPDKPVNEVTKAERKRLVGLLKGLEMTIEKTRGFEEAIITRGGVSVKEVDPGTMESKLVSGLFFAGELLDLDATTGGYNLQIAWSTGYLAGKCVKKTD